MTHLLFQLLPNTPIDEADILILPVPWERTVSYKPGTARAPEAIIKTADQLEYYEEDAAWTPMKYMTVHLLEAIEPKAGENEATFHANLEKVSAELPNENLLIALGGEHSITPALIQGRMPKHGYVIHLDAHADLRTSFEGSEYSHACPAYRILKAGYSIVMAGIRSIFETEAEHIAEDNKITLFMDRALRQREAWENFIKYINGLTGPVWLTIDMDVFDPALVSGVGTPQPGGFDWYQMVEVLEAVFFNQNIDLRGMDIVELIPEPSHVSEMVAAKLMQKAISFWGKSRGFEQRTMNGSQTQVDYD